MRRAGRLAVPRVSPFASAGELSVLDGSLDVLQPFTDRLIFSVRYLSTEKEAVDTESFPVGGTSIDSGFREELNLKRCRVSSSSPRFLVDFCKLSSGYAVS
jgi:hypothetical protein